MRYQFIVYSNMTHLILFLTVKYSIASIIRTPKTDVQKNVERHKSNKGSIKSVIGSLYNFPANSEPS